MDLIKITKIQNCLLEKSFSTSNNTLNMCNTTIHLTDQRLLIMVHLQHGCNAEIWIPYQNILTFERKSSQILNSVYYPLQILTRDFMFFKLLVPSDSDARDLYQSIFVMLSSTSPSPRDIHRLFCFNFHPKFPYSTDGWQMYDPVQEYDRLGVGSPDNSWRISTLNLSYSLSPTYPRTLVFPNKISDPVIFHAAKFRSRGRLPCLTYIHKSNMGSITRSSQPLVGIKSKRSIQDEKLLEAIFESNSHVNQRSASQNLIIDARPLGNAMANRAMGAGTESTEYYKNCKRLFMGIDNIHVMRDCHGKLIDLITQQDPGIDKFLSNLDSSNWLKHIRIILESAITIANNILSGGNVLIHCSDGWDRTAQLSSLASVILDPYYRTIRGLETLIEKEWLSFGHKFSDRLGHFVHHYKANGKTKKEQEMAPVFLQFLECMYDIMKQNIDQFEYNQQILVDIYKYAQNCQFGTFCLMNERERFEHNLNRKTVSLWSFINENVDDYRSPYYNPNKINDILSVSTSASELDFWTEMYSRHDDVFGVNICSDSCFSAENFTLLPYASLPSGLDNAAYMFAEHLRELEDQIKVQQLPDSFGSMTIDGWMKPNTRKIACSLCSYLFEFLDQQFRCRICMLSVCANCCRYKANQVRICDKCYGKQLK